MKKRTGDNTSRSIKLLQQAAATLVKVAGKEPTLRGVGDGVLQALSAAMPIAIRETERALSRMSARGLSQLESRLETFRVVEDLEAAIQLGEQAGRAGIKEIIDIIKGVIKKAKHFLPIPPPWILIIDEILELINKIMKLL
jgi:hypothetical protein